MGRPKIVTSPTMTMMMEITIATIGRLMKILTWPSEFAVPRPLESLGVEDWSAYQRPSRTFAGPRPQYADRTQGRDQ